MKKIQTPLTNKDINSLKVGDEVQISGIIYTARDAAHDLIVKAISKKEKLPFNLENQIIYYVGPSPKKKDEIIGSAGPTTSYRMDSFAPTLLDNGLKGMIGKGPRNEEVIDSIIKNNSVYFVTIGGAAALLSKCITEAEIIAYDFLGTEAIRKLKIKNMPCIVAIDKNGNNIFDKS